MSLILDNREHALIKVLQTAGQQHEVKALTVGDVWINAPEAATMKGLIVERKALADLQASLFDGRYREQKARLLSTCQELNMRPIYVLEGNMAFAPTNLSTSAIRKLINRLQLRYGIVVIQTESVADTADWIQTTCEQIKADPEAFQPPEGGTQQPAYWQSLSSSKKTNMDAPTFARQALAICPGLSLKAANALLEAHGPGLTNVMACDEKTLADVKVAGRRVGPAVVKRLMALLKGEEV
jgi:ERCC4-type nuclease